MTRINTLLLVLLVVSALALVSAQYRARQRFVDLETAQDNARKLEVQWNQLQLDQATWSKHALIDTAARHDLNMVPVTPALTLYVSPGEGGHPPSVIDPHGTAPASP